MNTTKKGDEFERKVFDLFSEFLTDPEFYLNAKTSRIIPKSKYYSDQRKKDIIFDIAIESYIGKSENFSSLTVIECKNYTRKVSVSEIEEFSDKLNQIGEHNTKGILATNSSFQEGAFNVAHAKKIGLIRINEDKSFEWVNYRKDKGEKRIEFNHAKNYLCKENAIESNFVGFIDNYGYSTISEMFLQMGIIDRFKNKSKFIDFPFLTKKMIEDRVREFSFEEFYIDGRLNIEALCSFLIEKYSVKFDFENEISTHESIIGKITFDPLTINISPQLKYDDPRWRFTFAHEVGHLILHQDKLNLYLEEHFDNENSFIAEDMAFSAVEDKLETQANIFASRLLLRNEYLLSRTKEFFNRFTISRGFIFVDTQRENSERVNLLLSEFRFFYGVSKEVAKYRLIEAKLFKIKED